MQPSSHQLGPHSGVSDPLGASGSSSPTEGLLGGHSVEQGASNGARAEEHRSHSPVSSLGANSGRQWHYLSDSDSEDGSGDEEDDDAVSTSSARPAGLFPPAPPADDDSRMLASTPVIHPEECDRVLQSLLSEGVRMRDHRSGVTVCGVDGGECYKILLLIEAHQKAGGPKAVTMHNLLEHCRRTGAVLVMSTHCYTEAQRSVAAECWVTRFQGRGYRVMVGCPVSAQEEQLSALLRAVRRHEDWLLGQDGEEAVPEVQEETGGSPPILVDYSPEDVAIFTSRNDSAGDSTEGGAAMEMDVMSPSGTGGEQLVLLSDGHNQLLDAAGNEDFDGLWGGGAGDAHLAYLVEESNGASGGPTD